MNSYSDILEDIISPYPERERETIRHAFSISYRTLDGRTRENGHPFIEHPLGVARIVASEIKLDCASVAAVFLHEASRFSPGLLKGLPKGRFPEEAVGIAESLDKIAAIRPKDTGLEAENYKRLIVSWSTDPRVIIIKLADRLDVMRNIDLLPKISRERKATETILLYVPIAHQLGLYRLKSEMEDIFFRYTDPENYRAISNMVKAEEGKRSRIVEDFSETIRAKLEKASLKFTIKGRTKTAYSIWKKMQKQGIPFEEVRDIFAIRIILDAGPERKDEIDACWEAYSIVTEEFVPDTSRLRDWLSKPKENGYESLHITVTDRNGNVIEVQIRTIRMDEIAENGHASHWSYKGIKEEKGLAGWLAKVREILESGNRSGYEQASRFLRDDVFVFTPDGELRRLPSGATVLDFAFDIHTNIGLKCTGARINGKTASIKEKLGTGDVVEIITGKNQKPSPDWLNYVVTSKAAAKIRLKLKEEEGKRSLPGKELLERRLKNWKIVLTDEDTARLCKKLKVKNANELYAGIGNGEIDIMEIKSLLTGSAEGGKEDGGRKEKPGLPAVPAPAMEESPESYIEAGSSLGNLSYKMARCCNPVYGDEVFGFISVRDGIKIHRMSCPNAARLIENYPYRIMKLKWKSSAGDGSFQATVKAIIGDSSLYGDLLAVVQDKGAKIRSSLITPRKGGRQDGYEVRIQVLVSGKKTLDKIISVLKKTRGVDSVSRVLQQ